MRTKAGIFRSLLPIISSKLNAGYTYEGVIQILKDNHDLELSLNTFKSYLLRFKNLSNLDLTVVNTSTKNLVEDVVEGVDVVEPVIDSAVEDAQPSSSILSRQKHNFVSLSRLNDEANRFLDAAEEKRLSKQSKS